MSTTANFMALPVEQEIPPLSCIYFPDRITNTKAKNASIKSLQDLVKEITSTTLAAKVDRVRKSDAAIIMYKQIIKSLPVGSGNHIEFSQDLEKAKKQKALAKQKLPYFCNATFYNERKASDIEQILPFVVLDFDLSDNKVNMIATRGNAMRWKHTLTAFISPSGGCKVLVAACGLSKNKETYKAQYKHICELYSNQVEWMEFDYLQGNLSQACFLSYDPDCKLNENAVPIDVSNIKPPQPKQKKKPIQLPVQTTETHTDTDILEWIYTTLEGQGNNFTDGNKHSFSLEFSCMANRFGVSESATYSYLYDSLGKKQNGAVKWAYEQAHEHGTSEYRGKSTTYKHVKVDYESYQRFIEVEPIEEGTGVKFPLEALPPVASAYAKALEYHNGFCADYVGAAVIAAASELIGTSASLYIDLFDWQFPANIWLGVVGDSSSGKSPSMKKALAPVKKVEAQAKDMYARELQEYEDQSNQKGVTPKKPFRRKFITGGGTLEGIQRDLSINPHGLLLFSDEILSWVNGFNQYKGGKGAEGEAFLSMYDGDFLSVSRVGDSQFIEPDKIHFSVLGGIQPQLLKTMVEGGKDNNGFLYRFLLCYPTNPPTTLPTHGEKMDGSIKEKFMGCMNELYSAASSYTQHGGEPRRLSLGELEKDFVVLVNDYKRKGNESDDNRLGSFYGKFAGHLGRLCLIMELLHKPYSQTISRESFDRAKCLLEYFEKAALRVFSEIQTDIDLSGIDLEAYKALEEEFSRKDLIGIAEKLGKSNGGKFAENKLKQWCKKNLIEKLDRGKYKRTK